MAELQEKNTFAAPSCSTCGCKAFTPFSTYPRLCFLCFHPHLKESSYLDDIEPPVSPSKAYVDDEIPVEDIDCYQVNSSSEKNIVSGNSYDADPKPLNKKGNYYYEQEYQTDFPNKTEGNNAYQSGYDEKYETDNNRNNPKNNNNENQNEKKTENKNILPHINPSFAKIDLGAFYNVFADVHEHTTGLRDWTHEFSQLQSQPETHEKWDRLNQLHLDFITVASNIGKIIISEMNLPSTNKTILPANVGGIAGGEKFIHKNILFKFARDVQFANHKYMYGGNEESTERAMKAAGLELIAYSRVLAESIKQIHFPLFTLIDYRGQRLLATSLVPINASTLIYGSCDAGRSIHASDVNFNKLMAQLGDRLNLKGHFVGTEKLHGPCDIEGHKGLNGEYYLLDMARMFPPQSPKFSQDPRAIFFQQLRPELVLEYPKALSSDAFSAFGRIGMGASEHKQNNDDAHEATEYLLNQIIPQLGQELNKNPNLIQDIDLVALLHERGINLRWIGALRSHITEPRVRIFLLTEMIARIMKNRTRAEWRRLDKLKGGNCPDSLLISLVCDMMNLLLGHRGQLSVFYLFSHLKEEIIDKFGENALSTEEKDPFKNLSSFFVGPTVVQRYADLIGADTSPRKALTTVEYYPTDIAKLEVKIKSTNLADIAGIHALIFALMSTQSAEHLRHSLDLALHKLKIARRSQPNNLDLLVLDGLMSGHDTLLRASTERARASLRLFAKVKSLSKPEDLVYQQAALGSGSLTFIFDPKKECELEDFVNYSPATLEWAKEIIESASHRQPREINSTIKHVIAFIAFLVLKRDPLNAMAIKFLLHYLTADTLSRIEDAQKAKIAFSDFYGGLIQKAHQLNLFSELFFGSQTPALWVFLDVVSTLKDNTEIIKAVQRDILDNVNEIPSLNFLDKSRIPLNTMYIFSFPAVLTYTCTGSHEFIFKHLNAETSKLTPFVQEIQIYSTYKWQPNQLCDFLRNFKHLKKLDLNGIGSIYQELLSVLEGVLQLEELKIYGNGATNKLPPLSLQGISLPNMKRLDVRVGTELLPLLLSKCINLEELFFQADSELEVEKLIFPKTLKCLTISDISEAALQKIPSNLPSLQTLNLEMIVFTQPETVQHLSLITRQKSVTKLGLKMKTGSLLIEHLLFPHLEDFDVRSEISLIPWKKLIENNIINLKSITYEQRKPDHASINEKQDCTNFSEWLGKNKRLESVLLLSLHSEIPLVNSETVIQALKQMNNLKTIELWRCLNQFEFFTDLFSTIHSLETVKLTNLSGNLFPILVTNSPALKSATIHSSEPYNRGIAFLLENCPLLEHLSLTGTPFLSEEYCRLLSKSSRLKSLSIQNLNASPAGLSRLRSSQNPVVKNLALLSGAQDLSTFNSIALFTRFLRIFSNN